ncbi:MAG: hypothetical protein K0R18_1014 [Bacillales bacterium]|jgi:hypothetical protein|nr:hypothetical protein [Bacillales bacterium]
MKILALDPGTKKIGYIVMDGSEVIAKGIILYKDFKYELNTILMFFTIDLCIIEKGGVPQVESKIKRMLSSKSVKYIEYESAKIREDLGLFEIGIDNQNKRSIIKKSLGFKEYNRDVMDAALLIVYYYEQQKKGE